MKDNKESQSFNGKISFLSLSPHGDPEGIVLTDGSFVKCPPHSLLNKDLFEIGAEVKGEGELLGEKPNRFFHHAKIWAGKNVIADDSGDKEQKEDLKEKHKRDQKGREQAPAKFVKLHGRVAAMGAKPKGEVDRLIFVDGTSVHIPKEVCLDAKDVEIGAEFEVSGEARTYGKFRIVKAEQVKAL